MSYYVNRKVINSSDSGACFVNEEKKICREIVTPDGFIRDFPGAEFHPDMKHECATFRGEPRMRYTMEFTPIADGRVQVLWTIQEEYFDPGDDWGFGREEIDAVKMVSFLDENGTFTTPFRLFSIEKRQYVDSGREIE